MKKSSSRLPRRARVVLGVETLEDRRVLNGLSLLPSSAATSLVSLQLPNLIAPVIVTTQPSVITPNTGTGSAAIVTSPAASAGPSSANLAASLLDSVLPTVAPIVNALPTTPNLAPTVTVTTPVSALLPTVSNILAPLLNTVTAAPIVTSLPLNLNSGTTGPTSGLLNGLLPTLENALTPLLSSVTTTAAPLLNDLTGALLGTGNQASGGLLGGLLSSVGGVLSPLLSGIDGSVASLLNNLPLLSSLGIGVAVNGGNGSPTTLSVTLPLVSLNLSLAPLPVPAVTAIVGVNAGPGSSGPGAPLPPISGTVSGDAGNGSQGGAGSVTVTVGPTSPDGDGGAQLPPGDGATSHGGDSTGATSNGGISNAPTGSGVALVNPPAANGVASPDAGTLTRDATGTTGLSPIAPASRDELGLFFAGQGDVPAESGNQLAADGLGANAALTTLFTTPLAFDGVGGTDAPLAATQTTDAISSTVVGPTGAAVPTGTEHAAPLTFALQDGDRLADGAAFNLATLEQEVQQLLSQLNNLHHDLTDVLATFGLSPWMFGLAVAAVMGMEGRRRLRRRKTTLAQALAGDDAALPWFLHCEGMLNAEQT